MRRVRTMGICTETRLFHNLSVTVRFDREVAHECDRRVDQCCAVSADASCGAERHRDVGAACGARVARLLQRGRCPRERLVTTQWSGDCDGVRRRTRSEGRQRVDDRTGAARGLAVDYRRQGSQSRAIASTLRAIECERNSDASDAIRGEEHERARRSRPRRRGIDEVEPRAFGGGEPPPQRDPDRGDGLVFISHAGVRRRVSVGIMRWEEHGEREYQSN